MLTRTRRQHPLPSGWHMPWRNSGMKGVGQMKDSVLGSLYILCFCSPVRGVSQQSVMGKSLSSRKWFPLLLLWYLRVSPVATGTDIFIPKWICTLTFSCVDVYVFNRNFLVAFVCVSFEKWILSIKANNLPYFQKVWWSAILIYHMVENSPVSLNFPALSPIPQMKASIEFKIPRDWARWGLAMGSDTERSEFPSGHYETVPLNRVKYQLPWSLLSSPLPWSWAVSDTPGGCDVLSQGFFKQKAQFGARLKKENADVLEQSVPEFKAASEAQKWLSWRTGI